MLNILLYVAIYIYTYTYTQVTCISQSIEVIPVLYHIHTNFSGMLISRMSQIQYFVIMFSIITYPSKLCGYCVYYLLSMAAHGTWIKVSCVTLSNIFRLRSLFNMLKLSLDIMILLQSTIVTIWNKL